MTETVFFDVPNELSDIQLHQWQKYVNIYNKNKDDANATDFLNIKMLDIFCGISQQDLKEIELAQFEGALNQVNRLLSQTPKLRNTFKMVGTDGVEVEFGLIPNFDKMSYGEFIDLEKYLYDDSNLHRAMAVLYRPIKHKNKGKYLIHKYKGTEYLADVMKHTPLDIVLASRVFFYRLATKLSNYTMVYTLKQLQEMDGQEDNRSVKNGETIKQYIHSLEKMLEESEKLLNFHSISA